MAPISIVKSDDAEDAQIELERLSIELAYFLKTGRCVKCNLANSEIEKQSLSGAKLTSVILEGANLTGSDLSESELGGAKLSGAILIGVNFRRANLKGADLSGANLTGANLREADLTGANLSGAQLKNADFWGAEIRRANLTELKVGDTLGITEQEVGGSGKISIFDR